MQITIKETLQIPHFLLILVLRMVDTSDTSAGPSSVVQEAKDKRPLASDYINTVKEIFTNLPYEVRNLGSIPCAQRSLYTGVLTGGVVSAIALVLTGFLQCCKC